MAGDIQVLIVEDDPDQVMLYSTKFLMEDIHVMATDNEWDVIQYLKGHTFDLVLMDILLSNSNGLDILEHIRQDSDLAYMPIAMFTNFDNRDARDRAAKLGAIDFIVKSDMTPKQVADRIKEIVAKIKSSKK